MSCNIEGTGFGPFEGAVIRIEPSGRITLATGAASQGQGHETVLAQTLADVLNVSPEDITVVTGDTRAIPYGYGAFASRIAVMATNSVVLGGNSLQEKDPPVRSRAPGGFGGRPGTWRRGGSSSRERPTAR